MTSYLVDVDARTCARKQIRRRYPSPIPRPDDRRLTAWRILLQAHASLIERLNADLEREAGLPLTQYEVLLHLSESPDGRLRMRDLADSVLLSPSGLTRLVDRMERVGLVARDTCSSDRRGSFAVLTPEGKAALRRAAPTHLRGIAEYFGAHVSDEEADALSAALSRIASAPRSRRSPAGKPRT